MVEVACSASIPKKQLSSSNAFGSKHVYDDVFSAPPKVKASSSFSSRIEDYSEIFGSVSSPSTSIPVLDLPTFDDNGEHFGRVESSGLDYSGIFGGSGDDCFALPPELLVDDTDRVENQAKKPRGPPVSSRFSNGPVPHDNLVNNETSSAASLHHTHDTVKLVNLPYNRANPVSMEGTKGPTQVVHLDAMPGFTSLIDEDGPTRKTGSDKTVEVTGNDADICIDLNLGNEQGKPSRKVISDLGANRNHGVQDAELQRGDGWGDFDEVNVKAKQPGVVPPSSPPHFFAGKGDFKRSMNPSGKASADSSPLLNEELDVNSAAAICAAAMKRAIEEAEAKIRLAKEQLERNEGSGSVKLSFKDTLKVKPTNGDISKENEVHESCAHLDTTMEMDTGLERRNAPASSALRVKVTNETKQTGEASRIQETDVFEDGGEVYTTTRMSATMERRDALEDSKVALDFEDQTKLLKDAKLQDKAKGEESKSTQQFHSPERGGEWEAAKHFSQLISGVKNRLVSFMAWQVDSEKRVMQKQVAAKSESPEQSEECDWKVIDTEVHGEREVQEEHYTTSWDREGEQNANETEFVPEVRWFEETESETSAAPEQETKGGDVEVLLGSENHKELSELPEPAENVEKIEVQELGLNESGNRQKGVLDDAEHEGTQEEAQEQNQEASDPKQDYERSAVDTDKTELHHMNPEEAGYLVGYDRKEAASIDAIDEMLPRLHGHEVTDETVDDYYESEVVGKLKEDFEVEETEMLPMDQEQQESTKKPKEACPVEEARGTEEGAEDAYEWEENEEIAVQTDQSKGTETLSKETDEACLVEKPWEREEGAGDASEREENERITRQIDHDEESEMRIEEAPEYDKHLRAGNDTCKQDEMDFLSTSREADRHDESNQYDKQAEFSFQENVRMVGSRNISSEHEKMEEESILAQIANEVIREILVTSVPGQDVVNISRMESKTEDACGTLPEQNFCFRKLEICVNSGEEQADGKAKGSKLAYDLENQVTESVGESEEGISMREADSVVCEKEKHNVESAHKRRRWFEGADKVGAAQQPSLFEGHRIVVEIDQEIAVTSKFDDSGKLQVDESAEYMHVKEAGTAVDLEPDTAVDQEKRRKNNEASHKRRRWFEKREEVGEPQQSSILGGDGMAVEIDHEIASGSKVVDSLENCVDELVNASAEFPNVREPDMGNNQEEDRHNVEAFHRRKRWFGNEDKVVLPQRPIILEGHTMNVEMDQEIVTEDKSVKHSKLGETSTVKGLEDAAVKVEPVTETYRDLNEVKKREREKQKERIAVEKAIREARERAFADARERAERAAMERATADTRQRVVGNSQDKLAKASGEQKSTCDKAFTEAKLRAERAAVERATAEARERALQKALSEKSTFKSREQAGRYSSEKSSSLDQRSQSSNSYYNSRYSNSSNLVPLAAENFDGASCESAQWSKARQERHKRTMERAAKALEEKNMRDLQVQREQAERNRHADVLNAEVKRWSSGKEGNLRALLSTLQYILGPNSGWQPIPLTDLVTTASVRKAYRKATLSVHPDKLQQRGATIQQKYICEKVFDLMKDAWHRFNPDER
ncbi:hypothetical protein Ancab_028930 [Ancistrocladus abbreviatus]